MFFIFTENEIDGDCLTQLAEDKDMLRELVPKVGPRLKLLKALKSIESKETSIPQPMKRAAPIELENTLDDTPPPPKRLVAEPKEEGMFLEHCEDLDCSPLDHSPIPEPTKGAAAIINENTPNDTPPLTERVVADPKEEGMSLEHIKDSDFSSDVPKISAPNAKVPSYIQIDDEKAICTLCNVAIALGKKNIYGNVLRHTKTLSHIAHVNDVKFEREFGALDKAFPGVFLHKKLEAHCVDCDIKLLLSGKNLLKNASTHISSVGHTSNTKYGASSSKKITNFFKQKVMSEVNNNNNVQQ